MKILLFDDYAARNGFVDHLGGTIAEFRADPALLGWYLADEPQHYGITPDAALRLNERFRQDDPSHPVVIVHSVPNLYRAYAPACDVMMVDIYPIGYQPICVIAEGIKEARTVVKDEKPVWAVIQMHQNIYVPRRGPTAREVRAMTYLALCSGAKGIFFFA
ncbi:MAG TPA: hypothetical protein GXX57_06940 [Firmicutes bacterium]|nr:hypothetical protein [Bacillota bacterium]